MAPSIIDFNPDHFPEDDRLDSYQALALERILQGHNVFASGPAGCGKSRLIRALRNTFWRNIAFCAPTALAAHSIGGITIHRLFQLPAEPYVRPGFIPALTPQKQEVLHRFEVLVIDEVSMVRADILAAIDRILRFCAHGDSERKPFGGKQIVILGDLAQLPPVVPAISGLDYMLRKNYGGVFPYQTRCWHEAEFLPVLLKGSHRQKADPEFRNLLDAIRLHDYQDIANGMALEQDIARFNSRFQHACPLDERPTLCAANADAERINARLSEALGSEPTVFQARESGAVGHHGLPAPRRLELRPGCRVIFTANRYDRAKLPVHLNGDRGIVTEVVDDDPPLVKVALDSGREIDVSRHRWPVYDAYLKPHPHLPGKQQLVQVEVGHFKQLPLRLGWAMTVHRAQGQTIPSCHIRLGEKGFRQPGQTYVALSRVPGAMAISLSRPLTLDDIRSDESTVKFLRHVENQAERPAGFDRLP